MMVRRQSTSRLGLGGLGGRGEGWSMNAESFLEVRDQAGGGFRAYCAIWHHRFERAGPGDVDSFVISFKQCFWVSSLSLDPRDSDSITPHKAPLSYRHNHPHTIPSSASLVQHHHHDHTRANARTKHTLPKHRTRALPKSTSHTRAPLSLHRRANAGRGQAADPDAGGAQAATGVGGARAAATLPLHSSSGGRRAASGSDISSAIGNNSTSSSSSSSRSSTSRRPQQPRGDPPPARHQRCRPPARRARRPGRPLRRRARRGRRPRGRRRRRRARGLGPAAL